MASFNPTTGAVTVGTTTITPLTDGSNLDMNYSNLISAATQTNPANFPKTINTMNLKSFRTAPNASQPSTINSIATDTTKLPAVIFITIESNPVTKILVYVNSSGTASYIVKVDPSNYSKLVPNGVQLVAPIPGTTAAPIPGATSTGTPPWVWVLVALFAFFITGGCVYLLRK